jgi:hypothetical protein
LLQGGTKKRPVNKAEEGFEGLPDEFEVKNDKKG